MIRWLVCGCLFWVAVNLVSATESATDTLHIPPVQEEEIELELVAEDSSSPNEKIRFIRPYKFFEPSKELNMPRTLATGGGIGVMYAATSVWWSAAWYAQYDRGKFRSFNDNGEWQQMDKAAHVFNAYFLSRWGRNLFNWSGVQHKHSVWIGMLIANMWQLSIELNDGFVPKWGFSWGDIGANISGSLIYGIQQYAWKEQRLNVKISAFPVKYPQELRERTDDLYGTTFSELVLKDYNAMIFWLNASPGSFIKKPESKFPKWISVSFGYGASGMYGGFDNKWCVNRDLEYGDCPPDDRRSTDIPRLRHYYLSLDVDFTKIPTRSHALKTLFEIVNIVKVPFPALEFRSDGKVRWNWLAF